MGALSRRPAAWLLAVAATAAACGGPEPAKPTPVNVFATEWSLVMARPVQGKGPWSFRLFNGGRLPHEFGLAPLDPGTTADQVIAKIRRTGRLPRGVEPIGIIGPAPPGDRAGRRLDLFLEPGRTYLFACFLPAQEGPDRGKPHAVLGMFGQFTA